MRNGLILLAIALVLGAALGVLLQPSPNVAAPVSRSSEPGRIESGAQGDSAPSVNPIETQRFAPLSSQQVEDATPQRLPVITGRFVDEAGDPLSPGHVAATDRIDPDNREQRTWQKVRIQEEGHFRMVVRHPVPIDGTYAIELQQLNENGGWIDDAPKVFFDVTPYAEPIDHHVGDVILGPGRLILGGRVIDQDGRPQDDVKLTVMRQSRPRAWLGLVNKFRRVSLGDGRFRLLGHRGTAPVAEDLKLKVKHRMSVSRNDAGDSFKLGETGRTFVIILGGGVAGSVDLGDLPARTISLRVIRRSATEHYGLATGVRADGTFEVTGLSPGFVDLMITPRGTASEPKNALAFIKRVIIETGKVNRESRLQGIPLARTPGSVSLTVRDSQGQPIADVDVLGGTNGVLRRLCSTDRDGRAQLVSETFETLVLMARGYRDRRLDGVVEDREVKLQAGHPVRLSVSDLSSLDEIVDRLIVRLLPDVPYAQLPRQRSNAVHMKPDQEGNAALCVPITGRFRVQWGVDRRGNGSLIQWVSQASPTAVTVEDRDAEQVFSVTAPVQAIRDRWNRDRP